MNFRHNHLHFPAAAYSTFFRPQRAADPQLTFVGSTSSTTNAMTHTFTDHAIGDAASDRLVIGGLGHIGSSGAITAATIGGDAATIHRSDNNGPGIGTDIFSLAEAAGTTSTFVVTGTTTMETVELGVWRLVNQNSNTPTDTGGSNGITTSLNYNIDVNDRGVLVTCCAQNSQTASAIAFVNATERYDLATEAERRIGGADYTNTSGSNQTNRTITATWDTSQRCALSGVSWR